MATPILNTPADTSPRPPPDSMLAITRFPASFESNRAITVAELLLLLWSWKWTLIATLIVAASIAYVGALLTPKEYKASVTISPVSSTMGDGNAGGLSSLANQFSGLASLAGLSMTGDARKWESLAVLKSAHLTEEFIAKNNLLPILYSRKWDAETKRWKVSDPGKAPTLWKANQLFKKHIREVTTDGKTGIATLSITWKDPKLAAEWANGLVQLANDYLRNQAILESDRHIAYLNQQAAKMDFIGAKQALYSLLENQINREMLARGTDQYAFKVLDPAQAPEKPSWPLPILWALLAAFVVLLLGTFTAYMKLAQGMP